MNERLYAYMVKDLGRCVDSRAYSLLRTSEIVDGVRKIRIPVSPSVDKLQEFAIQFAWRNDGFPVSADCFREEDLREVSDYLPISSVSHSPSGIVEIRYQSDSR